MNAIAFMAYAVVSSAIISLLALCVESLCDERRLPRRWAWVVGMTLSVIVPLTSLLPTTAAIEVSTVASPNVAIFDVAAPAARVASGVSLRAITKSATVLETLAPFDPVVRVLLYGSLLFVPLLVGVEWFRLRRQRRSWTPGAMGGFPVLVSDEFGPAVVGVMQPRIVVPAFVLALPETQQRLVLAHEREHLHAQDGRLSLTMLMMVALAPWNALLWWQFGRLRVAVELDCDARVLRREQQARAYGTLLIEMAARASRTSWFATAFLERFSSLKRRIDQIAPGSHRARRWQTVLAATFGAAALALMLVLPRPVVSQRTALAAAADSGAIEVMQLNRSGRWADAERVGLKYLASRPPSTESVEACAVLVGVTYAQALLRETGKARASMTRFDESCKDAVYAGFIPGESDRVRRLVNGEAVSSVYPSAGIDNTGWRMSGGAHAQFRMQPDASVMHEGRPTSRLAPIAGPASGYGTWMNNLFASPYHGKRIRVSAYLRTVGATQRADLWARVQAADSPGDGMGLVGQFIRLSATSEWQRYEVVLDVPSTGAWVQYGVGLAGPGMLWFDRVTIEVVDRDVAITSAG